MYAHNDKLTFHGNLSHFRSLYKLQFDPNGKIYDHYNQQLPNEPFFTANANIQYQFKNIIQKESRLFLNYAFGFVNSFYTIWQQNVSNKQALLDEAETPQQFIHDLGLTYTFPNKQFVLSFDAKNVFNNQAFDNFAVQKPGRAFYFKINYTFNKL